MTLSQQLQQKQTQSLVMTPQLQQAIKILELSNLELNAFLQAEMQSNPLIAMEESDLNPEDVVNEDTQEEDFDDLWSEENMSDRTTAERRENDAFKNNSLDYLEAATPTLKEHLFSQLSTDIIDPSDKLIGSFLIHLLEETGYFPIDWKEQVKKLGAESSKIESVIQLLQEFDPPGVFARSLSECLTLQLKDLNLLTEETKNVLDHLDYFENGRVDKLLKICNLSMDQLKTILSNIRLCNPKPGLLFSPEEIVHVVPDIILQGNTEIGWHLKINEQSMPRVNVDEAFYRDLGKEKHQSSYLKEKYQSANNLVKAIQQRAQTIMNVTEKILSLQHAFFEKGIHYLRPMTLQDIAKLTNLHESTISRVTTNKFLQTPRGMFELKFFFTSSLHNFHQDEDLSSSAVRERIRNLIKKEDPKNPLSDENLVHVLNEEGILVARRTISKYRESMNIPSSYQRKRQYACLI